MKAPPPLSQIRLKLIGDDVPEGWFDIDALAKAWSLSKQRAYVIAKAALENGQCDRKSFRLVRTERLQSVQHYYFK